MAKNTLRKQPSPKKTGLLLETEAGEILELWEYPFPELKGKRFELLVQSVRAEAARTEGKGRKGDVRHYSYLKHGGKSMYVAARLPAGSRVRIRAR